MSKSKCCNAPVTVSSGDEGTNFHVCSKCGKDCDVANKHSGDEVFPHSLGEFVLSIRFGPDQEMGIDKVIATLKEQKHIMTSRKVRLLAESSERDKAGLLHYDIKFNTIYAVYLFGHLQATTKPWDL